MTPRCETLVLDAGPLLSLSPIRGLARTYVTPPQVLSELKDARAREHFKKLGLISGVDIKTQSPDALSLTHVIQCAKKTGDYAVLSHADLCVLALTYALHEQSRRAKEKEKEKEKEKSDETDKIENPENSLEFAPDSTPAVEEISSILEDLPLEDDDKAFEGKNELQFEGRSVDLQNETQEEALEPLDVELRPLQGDNAPPDPVKVPSMQGSFEPIYDDPSDSNDGEGEWITPGNAGLHKSLALHLLPDAGAKGKKKADKGIEIGCMTADFAMQNVLLQMGLNLVGLEGQRIEKVKSWVLRCHACFKICKDNSKKFCPSCGNSSLLRASVTVAAPGTSPDTPAIQVHLKPNFQYKIRGTKYPIPAPKAGSAKTGAGKNLILREDQPEYMKAKRLVEGKREREEAKMLKRILNKGVEGVASIGSWTDPDWTPEMISVGAGGIGRTTKSAGMDGDLPQIGYGKKNQNERRRRR